MSHLFALIFNVKLFYLNHRYGPIRCYHSGQSGTGSDGNKEVHHNPQISSITGVSASDCLMSCLGQSLSCPVGWSCRIHRLLPSRGVRPPSPKGVLDMTLNDEAPVMLELRVMRSTLSLPSLPGPLMPGVVALDRVISMGQIEVNCVLMLNWIVCNRNVYMNKNGFSIK